MGLHMVAIAKLHLQLMSHHGLRPAVAGIVCPLVLKLLTGFRFCRDEALFRSRLFLFRLGHIAFNRETPLSSYARLERAVRLIWGTLHLNATASTPSSQQGFQIEHDTFHSLSIIAL